MTDHLFRTLFEQAQAGMCIVQDDQFVLVNEAFAAMHGCTVADFAHIDTLSLIPVEDRDHVRRQLGLCAAGKIATALDLRFLRVDGSPFFAQARSCFVEFRGRKALLISQIDVTALKQAHVAAEWRSQLLDQTEKLCHSGIVELDFTTGRVAYSPGLRSLLDVSDLPERGHWHQALRWVPREERHNVRSIWRGAGPAEPFEFQHRLQRADGRTIVVLHRGMAYADEHGRLLRGLAILQDITEQRDAERRIQELAHFDEVTGLANRALLLDRIDEGVHAARWQPRHFALLSTDVEQIADISETLGFGASDALAMTVAARLSSLVGPEDTLAYLGGGEFAWLVQAESALEATTLWPRARQILAALQAPACVGDTEVSLQCQVGVAVFPDNADSATQLLERAQAARAGGGASSPERVAFFTPEVNQAAMRRLKVEAALRHAVERQEFTLQYQPQVSLQSGEIVGLEALLRWQSPELGAVSPVEFIPVAEQTGLIVPIGDWVLRQTCEQVLAWHAAGLPKVRVAINLSARQLDLPDLARRIQAIVLATGADPRCLGVEITESMLSTDVQRVATTLRELRAIGMEISLDDFGTGYSNLGYLRSLPIDVLKVDRSYVQDVTAAPEDVSLTRAVITMAHSLQMKVLAEGVETEGQLSLLVANACDQIQGYLFSRPVPAAEVEAMLREGKRLPERFVARRQRQRTLLLVDDEPNIVAALKRLFRRDGYHIVTAQSGPDALQRLSECEIDVILSDQRMPGMTGVEFLRRAKELYPETVRMVLSGYTELQSITDAVNEGAIYKFLTKPWDDERLRVHVREAFHAKEMADDNRRLAREVHSANHELAAVNERLQQLLDAQRERSELEESRAASARDVLDHLPMPTIGIDTDGMVAFLNLDAQALLPDAASLIGREAEEALPPALREVWRSNEGRQRRIELRGRPYQAICRAMDPASASQGHLLVITPEADPGSR